MKARKGVIVVLLCMGLFLVYKGRAQETGETPQEEVVTEETTEAETIPSEPEITETEVTAEETPATPIETPKLQIIGHEPTTDETTEQEPSSEPDTPESQEEETTEPIAEEPIAEPEEQTETPPEAEPTEPTVQEEKPMSPDEVMGIDTVDLEDPQGNWLFKRVWWERAEAKYEKIRATVTKIMEMRTGFFAQRSELDKNILDPFYIQVGVNQGELTEIISNLIADLKTRAKTTSEETETFEQIQKDKKSLEQLQKEIQKINKQDQGVDRALMQLVDQVNKLRNYEQQAWSDFKEIARVLDDKKARELFYKVDNAWQNIKTIQEYVEQQFSPSFEKLVQEVQREVTRVQNDIEALKERGIGFKKQIVGEKETDQEEIQEAQPTEKKGIVTTVFSMIKKIFNGIIAIIRWPYDWFFGTKQPEVPAAEEQEVVEVAVEEPEQEPTMPQQEETPAVEVVEPEITIPEQSAFEAKEAAAEEMVETEQSSEEMPTVETEELSEQEPVAEEPEELPELGQEPSGLDVDEGEEMVIIHDEQAAENDFNEGPISDQPVETLDLDES